MGWFSDSGYQYPTSDSYTQNLSGDTWSTLSNYSGPAQQWDEGNGTYNGQGVNVGNYQALTDGSDKITGWRTQVGDDTFANYDSSGKYTGTQTFDNSLWGSLKSPLTFAAAMAAAGFGASALAGGLGSGATAAGVDAATGTAATGASDLGLQAGLSSSSGLNPAFDSLTQGGLYASDTALSPVMTTGQGTLSSLGADTSGGGLLGAAADSSGSLLGNGSAAYGGGGGLSDWLSTAKKLRAGTQLASGLYDAYAKNKIASSQQARLAAIDSMYAPGSAEYNALSQSLARKDAAAGRNSQYGTRATDLAAQIAQLKLNAANTTNSMNTTATTNKYGAYNSLAGAVNLIGQQNGWDLAGLF